ncbi:MAG: hypothetical protein ACREX9_06715 [Gammaproteobacteria bacterium]
MNKTLSVFAYLIVATVLFLGLLAIRPGEYRAGWSQKPRTEAIKLSNGFS